MPKLETEQVPFLSKMRQRYKVPAAPFRLNTEVNKNGVYSCAIEHLGSAEWDPIDAYLRNDFVVKADLSPLRPKLIRKGCYRARFKGKRIFISTTSRPHTVKRMTIKPGNAILAFGGPGAPCSK